MGPRGGREGQSSRRWRAPGPGATLASDQLPWEGVWEARPVQWMEDRLWAPPGELQAGGSGRGPGAAQGHTSLPWAVRLRPQTGAPQQGS